MLFLLVLQAFGIFLLGKVTVVLRIIFFSDFLLPVSDL